MKKNTDRFVHAIFCDDMRQEIGNKISFMGCYQSELFVPFAPVALPKLCVFVTVSTPIERPLKSLTIRVDQGSNTIANIETPGSDWAQSIPPASEDATRQLANVGVMLSPLAITEPGDIRVMVTTEEGELLGPRLRIKVTPQTEVAADAIEGTQTEKSELKAPAKKAASKRAPVKRV